MSPRRARRLLAAGAAALLGATLLTPAAAHAAPEPYVVAAAPDGRAAACKISLPCSITAARDKVRELLADGLDRDVVVRLADGRYHLDQTLELDARDSGTPEHTVTWTAAPGAHPVLDGGVAVTDWELVDDADGVWQGRAEDGGTVRQLFVDGKRAQRAAGAACTAQDCEVTDAGLTGPGVADLLTWQSPQDLEASVKIRWRNYRCGVDHVDGDTLVMEQPCWQNSSAGTGRTGPAWDTTTVDSSRYDGVAFFENAVELLAEPGDYAFDSGAGVVTYQAERGQDMSKVKALTPRTETLLALAGTPEAPVHDLVVDGIGFEHAAYLQPDTTEGYAGTQAGLTLTGESGPTDHAGRHYTKPAAAVLVQAGRGVHVTGATFRHLGGAGVVLENGTQGSGVTDSTFTDLSSGALYTGDAEPNPPAELESRDNTYERNTIVEAGVEFTDAVAIWGGYEAGTSISYNTLETLPYSGISLGWGWNQPEAREPFSRDNAIAGNRIIDTMMPWSQQADGGSIYTQGPQPETVIEENYIHKTTGNGVYLDEQSSYIHVTRNVVTGLAGPTWLSNWAGYGIENLATDNWSSAGYRPMNGRGSEQYDNLESLTWLPDDAVAVAAAAGATPPGEVYQLPRIALTVRTPDAPFTAGEGGTVQVQVTNADPEHDLAGVEVDVDWPDSWQVDPQGTVSLGDLAGGASGEAEFSVVPTLPDGVFSQEVPFQVSVTGEDGGTRTATVTGAVRVSSHNLAEGKPATQSSTYVLSSSGTPYPAENAVDGNVSNFAHTAEGDAQPWWQVDLGESVTLDAIALWNRADCCQERVQGVYVFVSDEPFTSEDPTETAGQPGVWSTFLADRAQRPSVIDVGARGRYVRIQLDSTTSMMNIAEVQVFGG
jgi:beta-glucuronidase